MSRIRDITIKENTFIRVTRGHQGDVELRVYIKNGDMVVSTRAGLYIPTNKIDLVVSAMEALKNDIGFKDGNAN